MTSIRQFPIILSGSLQTTPSRQETVPAPGTHVGIDPVTKRTDPRIDSRIIRIGAAQTPGNYAVQLGRSSFRLQANQRSAGVALAAILARAGGAQHPRSNRQDLAVGLPALRRLHQVHFHEPELGRDAHLFGITVIGCLFRLEAPSTDPEAGVGSDRRIRVRRQRHGLQVFGEIEPGMQDEQRHVIVMALGIVAAVGDNPPQAEQMPATTVLTGRHPNGVILGAVGLLEAVGCRQQKVLSDDGSPADVLAFELDGNLIRKFLNGGHLATHNPSVAGWGWGCGCGSDKRSEKHNAP